MTGHLALLLLQAALAVLALRELRRHVYPALTHVRHPHAALDVWLPLVVALPLALLNWRASGVARGPQYLPFGGPVACGWLALGAGLVAGPGPAHRSAWGMHLAILVWSATGLLLLLLAATDRVAGWVGNGAFAIMALLLWIGCGEEPQDAAAGLRRREETAEARAAREARAGLAMLVALGAAAGQGLIAGAAPPGVALPARAMILAFAAAAATSAALAGRDAALRVGGWAAAYGPLLALGILAFARLIPDALLALRGSGPGAFGTIAGGFAALAPEALGLLVLGPALLLAGRPGRARPLLGMALVAVAAAGAAWRLIDFA